MSVISPVSLQADTFIGALTGNADTATKLATPRAINGVNFDGSAAITIGFGTLSQDLLFTDATYDIGKSGATRPRDIFVSRNAVIGGTLAVTGVATFSGSVEVSGGTSGQGRIYSTAADGLSLFGKAGATSDVRLFNKNGSEVFNVPTGTTTASFAGTVGIQTDTPIKSAGGTGNPIISMNSNSIVELAGQTATADAGYYVRIPYFNNATIHAAAAAWDGTIVIDKTNNRLCYFSSGSRYYIPIGTSF